MIFLSSPPVERYPISIKSTNVSGRDRIVFSCYMLLIFLFVLKGWNPNPHIWPERIRRKISREPNLLKDVWIVWCFSTLAQNPRANICIFFHRVLLRFPIVRHKYFEDQDKSALFINNNGNVNSSISFNISIIVDNCFLLYSS